MTCFARSEEECWRLGGVCSTHPKHKGHWAANKAIDQLEQELISEREMTRLLTIAVTHAKEEAARARLAAIEECAQLLDTRAAEILRNQHITDRRPKAGVLSHWAKALRALAEQKP